MCEPVELKTKDDYSEHVFTKIVDGEAIQVVGIDAMTEGQWQRYCRETGTKPFQRLNVSI